MIWLAFVTTVVVAVKLWQAWQKRQRRDRLERAFYGAMPPSRSTNRANRRRQSDWRQPLWRSPSERALVKRLGLDATDRLMHNVALRYPEKSRQWCAEKALFDLERDRHLL
jgi:hypothetical protein